MRPGSLGCRANSGRRPRSGSASRRICGGLAEESASLEAELRRTSDSARLNEERARLAAELDAARAKVTELERDFTWHVKHAAARGQRALKLAATNPVEFARRAY